MINNNKLDSLYDIVLVFKKSNEYEKEYIAKTREFLDTNGLKGTNVEKNFLKFEGFVERAYSEYKREEHMWLIFRVHGLCTPELKNKLKSYMLSHFQDEFVKYTVVSLPEVFRDKEIEFKA